MSSLNDFMTVLSGHFDNKEQFDALNALFKDLVDVAKNTIVVIPVCAI